MSASIELTVKIPFYAAVAVRHGYADNFTLSSAVINAVNALPWSSGRPADQLVNSDFGSTLTPAETEETGSFTLVEGEGSIDDVKEGDDNLRPDHSQSQEAIQYAPSAQFSDLDSSETASSLVVTDIEQHSHKARIEVSIIERTGNGFVMPWTYKDGDNLSSLDSHIQKRMRLPAHRLRYTWTDDKTVLHPSNPLEISHHVRHLQVSQLKDLCLPDSNLDFRWCTIEATGINTKYRGEIHARSDTKIGTLVDIMIRQLERDPLAVQIRLEELGEIYGMSTSRRSSPESTLEELGITQGCEMMMNVWYSLFRAGK